MMASSQDPKLTAWDDSFGVVGDLAEAVFR
jgi:hypothetical protein